MKSSYFPSVAFRAGIVFLVLFFVLMSFEIVRASDSSNLCIRLFKDASDSQSTPALVRLQRAILDENFRETIIDDQHTLVIRKNGKVIFKSGYLNSEYPETLKALG